MSVLAALACALLAALVPYFVKLARVLFASRGQPGYIALFCPFSNLNAMLFPAHWRFNMQRSSAWAVKADLYRKFNSTVLVVTSLFPPEITVFVGEGPVMNLVNKDRHTFVKPPEANAPVLSIYGHNLLTSEGAEWRHHRKVSAPSFSEKNTAQVWETTMRLVGEWQEKVDEEQGEDGKTIINKSEDVWAVLTLLIMGKAGFGIDFPWPSTISLTQADEHLSFYQASKIVLRDWRPMSILPHLTFKLPNSKLQRIQRGYDIFGDELRKMVQERVEEVKKGVNRDDLLTALVKANLKEEGKDKLTDEELLSDAYIFLIAGHETTANSLSIIFLLLALYPSHQDPLHDEARSVFGSRPIVESSYPETYRALPITLATVQEGLRLAGPVSSVVKQAAVDTWLPAKTVPTEGEKSEEIKVFVPVGSLVRENISGIHYGDDAWPDPYNFNPKRFLEKEWNRESFYPFSNGLRGCIGPELVAVVSAILLKYQIEVPEHKKVEWQRREGETERERRERIMNVRFLSPSLLAIPTFVLMFAHTASSLLSQPAWALTLGPQGIDLAFVPRLKKEAERDA
ncbi:hypothetical protein JCM1841_001049 [Sporobolomyces salmonicolor]